MFHKYFFGPWQVASENSGGALEHRERQNRERGMKIRVRERSGDERLVGVCAVVFVCGWISVYAFLASRM